MIPEPKDFDYADAELGLSIPSYAPKDFDYADAERGLSIPSYAQCFAYYDVLTKLSLQQAGQKEKLRKMLADLNKYTDLSQVLIIKDSIMSVGDEACLQERLEKTRRMMTKAAAVGVQDEETRVRVKLIEHVANKPEQFKRAKIDGSAEERLALAKWLVSLATLTMTVSDYDASPELGGAANKIEEMCKKL